MCFGCYFIATNLGSFKRIKEKEQIRKEVEIEMQTARRNELLNAGY